MLDEDWRVIAGFDDYAVHESGQVKRIKADCAGRYLGRVLKPSVNSGGYPHVTLARNGEHFNKKTANLVCEAFHGSKPSASHQVAHNNGNKADSSRGNVRWATPLENAQDKQAHGTVLRGDMHPAKTNPGYHKNGAEHHSSKLTEDSVREIRMLRAGGEKQTVLARKFGITQSSLWAVLNRKTWSHAA